jgi:hypothetical protein
MCEHASHRRVEQRDNTLFQNAESPSNKKTGLIAGSSDKVNVLLEKKEKKEKR